MIRNLLLIIFCLLAYNSYSQLVFPYLNYQDYLKSFHEGFSTQLDYLKPIDVKYSEDIIAFIDNKRDLFVFDGKTKEKEKLSGLVNDYKIGRKIVAWNTGPVINVWDNGRKINLTYFGNNYEVSDSLVVFEDERDNAIRVYYKGEIIDLYTSVTYPEFPKYIGSNTVAFRGNGGVNYVFIAGKIIEIGVFSEHIKYNAGGNLVVFNDPFNQSFAVVFPNEVLDVEPTLVQSYKTGYDNFVYLDRNNNLKAYVDGRVVELSSYASSYQVFRNTIVWIENGVLYTYQDGNKYEIANYIPEEYLIRDGIVAFRNLNRGVSLFHNKRVDVISNLINAPFEVNGNTVRVEVHKGYYDFFKNGYSYPTTKQ